jgi:hypothetical protein
MSRTIFVGWVSGFSRNPPVVNMRPLRCRKWFDRRVTACGLTHPTQTMPSAEAFA